MSPGRKAARMVVLEGIDGCGKSTLGKDLTEALRADGQSASWHPNRNLAPVRAILDAVARENGLRDRVELLGRDEAQFLAATLKLRDYLGFAEEWVRPDHTLVIDRYYYTHLALAVTNRTDNLPRLRRLFQGLPRPDIVLYLGVSPETALRRITARNTDTGSLESLADFDAAYRGLAEYGSEFTVVDAEQDQAAVLRLALELITARAERSRP